MNHNEVVKCNEVASVREVFIAQIACYLLPYVSSCSHVSVLGPSYVVFQRTYSAAFEVVD